MSPDKGTQEGVKPTDALGRLSERARSSRLTLVVVVIAGIFLLAFFIGLIVRGVSGGVNNAPSIPRVEI